MSTADNSWRRDFIYSNRNLASFRVVFRLISAIATTFSDKI
jgi:hypothetical protein